MPAQRYDLRGAIDLVAASKLREVLKAIINESNADVLVDCADLTFIDSTGIAVLLEAHRDLEARGRHMVVVHLRHSTRRTFELLGLTDLVRYDQGPAL